MAKDVCDVLGLIPRDSVRHLDEDERETVPFVKFAQLIRGDVPSNLNAFRASGVTITNEPGLYSLILGRP